MSALNQSAELLRLVAEFIDRLSAADAAALLDGRRHLHLTDRPLPVLRKPKGKVKAARVDPDAVADALRGARTREEAMTVLAREGVSKVVLEKLARRMDLPVLRSDSVERVRQRIVEAAIGYRINSEAIQGRPRDDSPE